MQEREKIVVNDETQARQVELTLEVLTRDFEMDMLGIWHPRSLKKNIQLHLRVDVEKS